MQRIVFPEENVCHLCSRPAVAGSILCLRCEQRTNEVCSKRFRNPPGLDGFAAAWRYREPVKQLVHLFKYQNDPSAARFLAAGMTRALIASPDLLRLPQLIVPVPLHESRLRERGYNQAALLAWEVSAHTGLPCDETVLLRVAETPPLEPFSRTERVWTLKDVFAVAQPQAVHGRNILLVDDVFTTGSTVRECARTLRRAGAGKVFVLCACRA